MFQFELKFALLVASGATTLSWTPLSDVLILQIDTTAAVVLSTDARVYPPLPGITDAWLFACSQAGRFDCGLFVKQGSIVFANRSGAGAYTISLAYQPQMNEPEPAHGRSLGSISSGAKP